MTPLEQQIWAAAYAKLMIDESRPPGLFRRSLGVGLELSLQSWRIADMVVMRFRQAAATGDTEPQPPTPEEWAKEYAARKTREA